MENPINPIKPLMQSNMACPSIGERNLCVKSIATSTKTESAKTDSPAASTSSSSNSPRARDEIAPHNALHRRDSDSPLNYEHIDASEDHQSGRNLLEPTMRGSSPVNSQSNTSDFRQDRYCPELTAEQWVLQITTASVAVFMGCIYGGLTWEKIDNNIGLRLITTFCSAMINAGLYEITTDKWLRLLFGLKLSFGQTNNNQADSPIQSYSFLLRGLTLFGLTTLAVLPALPLYKACTNIKLGEVISLTAWLVRAATSGMSLMEFPAILRKIFVSSQPSSEEQGAVSSGALLQFVCILSFFASVFYTFAQHAPISSGIEHFLEQWFDAANDYENLNNWRYAIEAVGVFVILPFNIYFTFEGASYAYHFFESLCSLIVASSSTATDYKPLVDADNKPLQLTLDTTDEPITMTGSMFCKNALIILCSGLSGAPALALTNAADNDQHATQFDFESYGWWVLTINGISFAVGALMNLGSFSKNCQKTSAGWVSWMANTLMTSGGSGTNHVVQSPFKLIGSLSSTSFFGSQHSSYSTPDKYQMDLEGGIGSKLTEPLTSQ